MYILLDYYNYRGYKINIYRDNERHMLIILDIRDFYDGK